MPLPDVASCGLAGLTQGEISITAANETGNMSLVESGIHDYISPTTAILATNITEDLDPRRYWVDITFEVVLGGTDFETLLVYWAKQTSKDSVGKGKLAAVIERVAAPTPAPSPAPSSAPTPAPTPPTPAP